MQDILELQPPRNGVPWDETLQLLKRWLRVLHRSMKFMFNDIMDMQLLTHLQHLQIQKVL